ncbi:TspO/MBR family protein [Streptomyces cinereoruber]|uniref:TspO/MBR family protein n=1 Tax=Streptomyces cinereoruber TaxID=67260 RepID=UPI0036283E06
MTVRQAGLSARQSRGFGRRTVGQSVRRAPRSSPEPVGAGDRVQKRRQPGDVVPVSAGRRGGCAAVRRRRHHSGFTGHQDSVITLTETECAVPNAGSSRTGRKQRGSRWPVLLGLLALCYAVAALGGLASTDAGDTYNALDRPAWAPPGWLFGPVWTVLYGTIAVAAWLVLRNPHGPTRTAMTWWSVQLLLNLAWTPLFFTAGEYGLAFLDICLLLAALLTTMVLFARHCGAAALLLVPYALWVTFASALNLAIWLSHT